MLNHDKCYILGLFVGNGTIANGTFVIKLPFKKWGMAPHKMNDIARDILTKISSKFSNSYNFAINYDIGNNEWILKPNGNANISTLLDDLLTLKLPINGVLLKQVDLTYAKKSLKGINLENFLTGIFDTRCSLTKSHRRFNDEAPIVSLEIPGSTENFNFVKDICSWLNDQGTITDQILFNHPSQHSPSNPNYKNWKKGFKIRFLVNSFLEHNSFALKAKAVDIGQIKKSQKKQEQTSCSKRKIQNPSPVSIHSDINSESLPIEVRGKLFFHYLHYCAVLGCKHAPLVEIKKLINNYQKYIFALPRLEKGKYKEIKATFLNLITTYLQKNKKTTVETTVESAINSNFFQKYLELEQGIAFLFAKKLNGNRHSGSKDQILSKNMHKTIKIYKVEGSYLPPLMMSNPDNDRSVIISSLDSELNTFLVNKHISINGLNVEVI